MKKNSKVRDMRTYQSNEKEFLRARYANVSIKGKRILKCAICERINQRKKNSKEREMLTYQSNEKEF